MVNAFMCIASHLIFCWSCMCSFSAVQQDPILWIALPYYYKALNHPSEASDLNNHYTCSSTSLNLLVRLSFSESNDSFSISQETLDDSYHQISLISQLERKKEHNYAFMPPRNDHTSSDMEIVNFDRKSATSFSSFSLCWDVTVNSRIVSAWRRT